MDSVKKIVKYVLLIVGVYFLTNFLIYMGFNSTYRDIKLQEIDPTNQINVEFAQATKVNGRIFGKVTNTSENNLNGKYIRVDIMDKDNVIVGTKYLELKDIKNGENKFAVYFKQNEVKNCEVSIVEEKDATTEKLFDGIFISEDLKKRAILGLLVYMIFA